MRDAARARVPLREHAYARFTERLLKRDIAPGQIVTQRELVDLTGFPLGAIREMIPRLEADGLIRTVPQKGLQVLTIDIELIRDCFQLRWMIEREAFSNYAARATDAEIAAHAEAHRAVRSEAERDVTPALLDRAQRMDWAFHDAVIDALGNRIVSDIHRVNAIKLRLIRNSDTRMLPELVVSVLDEHLAIIDALALRDTAMVTRALAAHLRSAKLRVIAD